MNNYYKKHMSFRCTALLQHHQSLTKVLQRADVIIPPIRTYRRIRLFQTGSYGQNTDKSEYVRREVGGWEPFHSLLPVSSIAIKKFPPVKEIVVYLPVLIQYYSS